MRHYACLPLAGLVLVAGNAVAFADARQVGLKAGASVASLNPETSLAGAAPYDVRAGLAIGAFAVLPVQKRLAIQIEALFTDKGGAQPLNDPSIIQGSITNRFLFRYLDVPVLARVTGPRVKAALVHGFAGPTFSARLSAKHQTAFGGGAGSFGYERKLGDEVRRFDLGLTFGGGVEIGRRLVFDARYTFGLNDVLADQGGTPLTNRGFLITAGARIF